jgi:hypothetical protein
MAPGDVICLSRWIGGRGAAVISVLGRGEDLDVRAGVQTCLKSRSSVGGSSDTVLGMAVEYNYARTRALPRERPL